MVLPYAKWPRPKAIWLVEERNILVSLVKKNLATVEKFYKQKIGNKVTKNLHIQKFEKVYQWILFIFPLGGLFFPYCVPLIKTSWFPDNGTTAFSVSKSSFLVSLYGRVLLLLKSIRPSIGCAPSTQSVFALSMVTSSSSSSGKK